MKRGHKGAGSRNAVAQGLVPLVGFGLLVGAAFPCVTSNSPLALLLGSTRVYRPFLMGALAGAAVLCAALLLAGAVARRRAGGGAAPAHAGGGAHAVTAVAGLLGLAGLSALGWASVHGETPAGVLAALGVLFGCAMATLGLGWARVYSRLPFNQLTQASALSFLVAVVLAGQSLFVSAPASVVLVGVELALSVAALMVTQGRLELGNATDEAATACPEQISARQLWQPLLLGALVAWVFGMVWDPSMTPSPEVVPPGYGPSLLVGALVACGLYGALVATQQAEHAFAPMVLTVVFPVVAAAFLVLPTLAGSRFVPASFVLNGLSWALSSLMFLLLWTQLVHASAAQPKPALLGLAVCCAATLAGMALVPVLGGAGQAVSLTLFAAYLVLTAIGLGQSSRRHPGGSPTTDSPASERESFELRCAMVARERGLSPRESEVLAFLARGHSQAYVAEQLGITESTVHSHARKIYEKLGVSSKQELIALMTRDDGGADAGEDAVR